MLKLRVIRESPFTWLPLVGTEITVNNQKRWLTKKYSFPNGETGGPYCELISVIKNHKRLSKQKIEKKVKKKCLIKELSPTKGEDKVTAIFRERKG